jgi:outer membrane protein assembly factor BamB
MMSDDAPDDSAAVNRRRISRRTALAALGAGAAVATGGCTAERSTAPAGAWSYPGGDVGNTNRSPDATGVVGDPSVAWTAAATDGVFTPPVVAGGVAYAGDADRTVHAIDAADGTVRWRTSVGYQVWELAVMGDTLYAAADRVYALDRRSGRRRHRWRAAGALHRVPDGYCRGPVGADGRLYVTSYRDEAVYALDPDWGRPLWRAEVGPVRQTPAFHEGTCYVATGATIYALSATDGTLRWSFDRAGNEFVSPTVADAAVFTGDRGVYALDGETGEERWHRPSLPRPSGGLAYAAGLVFCGDTHRGVFALDAETGEERWQTNLPGSVRRAPTVAAGGREPVVYATTKDGYVAALTARDGTVLWKHAAGGSFRSPSTPVDGMVLCADESGTVTAISGRTSG